MDKDSIINSLNALVQRVSIEISNLKELVKILRDNLK